MASEDEAYAPAKPRKTNARHVMADGSAAPTCFVRFRCLQCGYEVVEDAFLGPVGCVNGHPVNWKLEALGIVRSTPHPDSSSEHAKRLEKFHEQFETDS